MFSIHYITTPTPFKIFGKVINKRKAKEYESLSCLTNATVVTKLAWKEETLVQAHTFLDLLLGADPGAPVFQELCSAGSRTRAKA